METKEIVKISGYLSEIVLATIRWRYAFDVKMFSELGSQFVSCIEFKGNYNNLLQY